MQLGMQVPFVPGDDAAQARRVEDDGFDVGLFGDSQHMIGDPYARMAFAASTTTQLRLCTGVTNPATRDASVTADAALTVHVGSGGRAILGIGRGDSALAKLGLSYPAPLREFEAYVRQLRGYFDGVAVERHGRAAAIEWLPEPRAALPIDIACTGPRTIRLAATLADRVTFSVGAEVERMQWAIDQAESAIAARGRDRSSVTFGAFVILAVGDDVDECVAAVKGKVAGYAHFSGMPDSNTRILADAGLRDTSSKLQDGYDHTEHMRADAEHAKLVDAEFARTFAIVGAPGLVADRMLALAELGIDHFYCSLVHRGADRAFIDASRGRFAAEVVPRLRAS